MSVYQIEIQVDSDFVDRVEPEMLQRIAQATLEAEQAPEGTGLTLVITGDEQIRALNRQFNETDRPTDVLSFSNQEGTDFISPDEEDLYLGDVIISYPTALAQATEHGHPVEQELALLIVHGCLHLLGYDHATDDEREQMWARQEAVLGRVV
ncbi:MAG: rRNA maturation RNase YbeY [Chloroflexi bacterium]|jgi:probable rRNA maturation factor|nr:rRNA maturation RNase YbeY [Chloroflexota bacterium]